MSNYVIRCTQTNPPLFYEKESVNERSPWMSTHVWKDSVQGAMKFHSRDDAYEYATSVGLWDYEIEPVNTQLELPV